MVCVCEQGRNGITYDGRQIKAKDKDFFIKSHSQIQGLDRIENQGKMFITSNSQENSRQGNEQRAASEARIAAARRQQRQAEKDNPGQDIGG